MATGLGTGPRRDDRDTRELGGTRRFMMRSVRGGRDIGSARMLETGNATQSRSVLSGARSSRARCLPSASQPASAYYSLKVRERRPAWTLATYPAAISQ
jgi:hypothetical protein